MHDRKRGPQPPTYVATTILKPPNRLPQSHRILPKPSSPLASVPKLRERNHYFEDGSEPVQTLLEKCASGAVTQPGDPPIGETVLFPFTLRVPYTMPPFSAVVPTPDTNGEYDLMVFPQAKTSVRKIKAVKPAAEIVAEMMAEAREILRAELAATSEGDWHRNQR